MLAGEQGLRSIPAAPKHLLLAGFLVPLHLVDHLLIAPHSACGPTRCSLSCGHAVQRGCELTIRPFAAQVSPLGVAGRAPAYRGDVAGVWLTQQLPDSSALRFAQLPCNLSRI